MFDDETMRRDYEDDSPPGSARPLILMTIFFVAGMAWAAWRAFA